MSKIWYHDPQWWAIIISGGIACLSFFKEKINDLFFKAKIDVEFKIQSPNCHKTRLIFSGTPHIIDCYYYRLKITSINSISPKELEVMIVKKYKKIEARFVEDKNFLPMSLVWSHYKTNILGHIPPGLFKFCDFGYIADTNYSYQLTKQYLEPIPNNELFLDMDLEIKPNTGSSVLPVGIYKFEIVITGQNVKSVHKTFEVTIPKFWSNDESEMLKKGLSVNEIKTLTNKKL